MKLRWLIPVAVLIPLRLSASRHTSWSTCRHCHDQSERGHGPSSAAGV